jgi:GNAT superfamily N-acetyltransferase
MTPTFRATKRKDGCRVVFAYTGREKIGWIGACPSSRYLEVQKTHVVENYRRQKIGTALYTKLAQIACDAGTPLASYGWQRNASSEAFWQKQLRLGRAYVDPAEPKLTVIKCPVTTLERRRRKRR